MQRLPEIPEEEQFLQNLTHGHSTLQTPFNAIVLLFALQ